MAEKEKLLVLRTVTVAAHAANKGGVGGVAVQSVRLCADAGAQVRFCVEEDPQAEAAQEAGEGAEAEAARGGAAADDGWLAARSCGAEGLQGAAGRAFPRSALELGLMLPLPPTVDGGGGPETEEPGSQVAASMAEASQHSVRWGDGGAAASTTHQKVPRRRSPPAGTVPANHRDTALRQDASSNTKCLSQILPGNNKLHTRGEQWAHTTRAISLQVIRINHTQTGEGTCVVEWSDHKERFEANRNPKDVKFHILFKNRSPTPAACSIPGT